MSDIFEQDIDESEEDIAKLEDAEFKPYEEEGDEHFVYPKILYQGNIFSHDRKQNLVLPEYFSENQHQQLVPHEADQAGGQKPDFRQRVVVLRGGPDPQHARTCR